MMTLGFGSVLTSSEWIKTQLNQNLWLAVKPDPNDGTNVQCASVMNTITVLDAAEKL